MKSTIKIMISLLAVAAISFGCKNNQNTTQNESKEIVVESSATTDQKLNQSEGGKITILSPAEFAKQISNQNIVDVRTPEEYNEGHIEGAVNINLFDEDFLSKASKLDKNKPVYVYCKSGGRSARASKQLAENGFKNVYDLDGGILNWVKENNKTVK